MASAAARGGFAPRLAARQDECGVVLGIHLVQRLAGFDRVAVLAVDAAALWRGDIHLAPLLLQAGIRAQQFAVLEQPGADDQGLHGCFLRVKGVNWEKEMR